MKSFWSGKRITVTGGAGFLGQHVVKRLESYGANVFVPRQRDYNLVSLDACMRCLLEHPCDFCFTRPRITAASASTRASRPSSTTPTWSWAQT